MEHACTLRVRRKRQKVGLKSQCSLIYIANSWSAMNIMRCCIKKKVRNEIKAKIKILPNMQRLKALARRPPLTVFKKRPCLCVCVCACISQPSSTAPAIESDIGEYVLAEHEEE